MQYLNLGLPRSGLQSISLAASMLGLNTRPKHPFTHRNWLDQMHKVDLLQGHPFSAHTEQVIATLQSLHAPLTLFYTIRPLHEWLESCHHHFQKPSPDPWENQSRLLWFDTLTYQRDKFLKAYATRAEMAKRLNAHLVFLEGDNPQTWKTVRHIFNKEEPPFPHQNKTLKVNPPAYQDGELVA